MTAKIPRPGTLTQQKGAFLFRDVDDIPDGTVPTEVTDEVLFVLPRIHKDGFRKYLKVISSKGVKWVIWTSSGAILHE